MQQINYGVNRVNNNGLAFRSLQQIHKKAYKIGGQALRDAESAIADFANENKKDVHVIPKKGLISKVKSLIFFVTNEGEKKGRYFSLSIDPKKLMHKDGNYKTVDKFTKENINDAVVSATQDQQAKGAHQLKKNSATLLPVDSVYIARWLGFIK